MSQLPAVPALDLVRAAKNHLGVVVNYAPKNSPLDAGDRAHLEAAYALLSAIAKETA